MGVVDDGDVIVNGSKRSLLIVVEPNIVIYIRIVSGLGSFFNLSLFSSSWALFAFKCDWCL
jgi:hypothetical protein